jgi:hypothetical protein
VSSMKLAHVASFSRIRFSFLLASTSRGCNSRLNCFSIKKSQKREQRIKKRVPKLLKVGCYLY